MSNTVRFGPRLCCAQSEIRVVMGRPDGPHQQGVFWHMISPEHFAAIDFGAPIQTANRLAHRCTRQRRHDRRRPVGRHHRRDDLAVSRAAAKHTGQRRLHLRLRRFRHRAQQFHRRHHHTRRAYPALRGTMIKECVLQALRHPLFGRFQRLDRATIRLRHGGQAGAMLCAIDQDGAGPTIARIAPDFDALEVQIIAQHL